MPSVVEPSPAALAEHLHTQGFAVEPHFRGDDLGWTAGELRLPGAGAVELARYLTKEDDLRDDLNAFAAELELVENNPHSGPLMERVIQTKQLVTLRPPDGPDAARVVEGVCRFLASTTGGVFQIDGRGWFAADGLLLVPEG